jgi:S1-C subfamily serine protease
MDRARASVFVLFVIAAFLLTGCAHEHKISTIEHPQVAVVWMMSRAPDSSRSLTGCGFLVSKDGLIVTSRHCVPEHGKILVQFCNGQTLPADFVEEDPEADMALIQVHGTKFPFLKLYDNDIQPGMHFRIVTGLEVVHGVFDHWENFGADMELNAGGTGFDCGAPVLADDGAVMGMVRWGRPQKTECLATLIWHVKRMMPRLGE